MPGYNPLPPVDKSLGYIEIIRYRPDGSVRSRDSYNVEYFKAHWNTRDEPNTRALGRVKMVNKYTYRKSDGEDIWTVGHNDNGKWIPESDWDDETFAIMRVEVLNNGITPDTQFITVSLRKRIEEMMEWRRQEQQRVKPPQLIAYHRGAADACGLILDLPELRLFLPAKGEK